MKIEVAEALASVTSKGVAASAIGTAIAEYLESNYIWIGSLCTIITLLVYIFFQLLVLKKTTLTDENKRRLDEHIKETKEELSQVKEGIASILNKLNKLDKE